MNLDVKGNFRRMRKGLVMAINGVIRELHGGFEFY